MNKKSTIKSLLFVLLGTQIYAQDYCEPTWSGWAVDEPTRPISLVQFGVEEGIENAIDNTSTSLVSVDTPRYEDFTSNSVTVAKGSSYTLKIKGNTDGNNTDYVTVYFDWNGDGTFSNATPIDDEEQQQLTNQPEKHQHLTALTNSTGEDDLEITHTVTIPTDAATGSIRMRIVKNYNAPSTHPCDNAFIFGQIEDYVLNISEEEIVNPSVCSEPGENPGDTGCITFTYQGNEVTYTTVRGADGNIWLQQNLGSDGVATSSTDSNAFGDLFQWGRWDDGHQLRSSTVSYNLLEPNNPTALGENNSNFYNTSPEWWSNGTVNDTWNASVPEDVTATDGCDPCKALAEGWEIPTATEWQTIIDAEQINDIETAFESNLKLTVAGSRNDSGLYNEGTKGYYWSKTISSTNPQFAKYLYYSDFIVNTGAGGVKAQGSSVRCIYKQPAQQELVLVITTEDEASTEIVEENGTLQLTAEITPSDANQNVVWSVEEGLDVVSVDENGLVTANENGIATVRATSTEDDTVFDEIEITVNYENSSDELCEAVDTFLETFEDFTAFPENCWSSDKSAPYADIDTHNDSQVFRFYSFFSASDPIYLVSPEVTTIDGNHVLSFDIAGVEDNALTTTFQVGTLSDNTDFSTFIPAEEAFNPESGTTHTSVPVPANSGHKYVAIKFTPDAMHQAVFVDNIEWKIAASSDKFDKNLVSLYPNPTYDFIHINTELSISNIEVYNNLGQRIFVTNYFNDTIDLSNYPAGIYLVRLQTVDGEMAEYKVIKK